MNDYTANAGYATWHARNWRWIPSETYRGAVPASAGGLEILWMVSNEEEGWDKDVSFFWNADGSQRGGSYRIVDRVTDETLDYGSIRDTDALIRILRDAITNAA